MESKNNEKVLTFEWNKRGNKHKKETCSLRRTKLRKHESKGYAENLEIEKSWRNILQKRKKGSFFESWPLLTQLQLQWACRHSRPWPLRLQGPRCWNPHVGHAAAEGELEVTCQHLGPVLIWCISTSPSTSSLFPDGAWALSWYLRHLRLPSLSFLGGRNEPTFHAHRAQWQTLWHVAALLTALQNWDGYWEKWSVFYWLTTISSHVVWGRKGTGLCWAPLPFWKGHMSMVCFPAPHEQVLSSSLPGDNPSLDLQGQSGSQASLLIHSGVQAEGKPYSGAYGQWWDFRPALWAPGWDGSQALSDDLTSGHSWVPRTWGHPTWIV